MIMFWLQEDGIVAVVGLVVAVVLLWWLFGRAKPGEIVPPAIEPAKPAKPLEPAKPEIIAAEPARFKPIEPKPQPVVPAAPPPAPEPVAKAPPSAPAPTHIVEPVTQTPPPTPKPTAKPKQTAIGNAECGERGCKYDKLSVVAVSLKKKRHKK